VRIGTVFVNGFLQHGVLQKDRPETPPEADRPAGDLSVLELFCGIGGLATALRGTGARIAEATDINHRALAVVGHNFSHPTAVRLLDSVAYSTLADIQADLWWLSPPCQPFTRRGKKGDDEDPRSRPLLHLMGAIAEIRPRYLALENVPQIRDSRCRDLLLSTLSATGYQVQERLLCPTALGFPNRRLRYYLVASREGLLVRRNAVAPKARQLPLETFLDPRPDEDLALDSPTLERYRPALHIVQPGDPFAITHCFTSAYGRSPVRSGSYLATVGGVRRFSPEEVLRLLGFPPDFGFPEETTRSARWRLAGNSLSTPAVRHVLAAFPELCPAS